MALLPEAVVKLINSRGHLRNLESRLARDYPGLLQKLGKRYAGKSFAESVYLELGHSPGACPVCQSRTRFVNFVVGYKKHCSLDCARADPAVTNKRKETCLDRFGATSPMGCPQVKEKFTNTMKDRYGVDWAMQSVELRSRAAEACLHRYGSENFASSSHWAGTERCRESSVRAQKAREATMLRRYGVTSPLQIPEVFERQSSFGRSRKILRLDGKVFSLQGYEPTVVRYMCRRLGYEASDIAVTKDEGRPTVRYSVGSKTRVYYPDIFVQSTNQVIEVKSSFTLGIGKPSVYRSQVRKWKAAAASGYETWLAYGYSRGRRVLFIKDPQLLSYEQMLGRLNGRV